MNSEYFSQQLVVPASAIDEREHVNNLSYLQWCLDAAEAHWKRNASAELLKKYVWYVLRHTINYKAAAYEGEVLEIKTWVESSEGVRSERAYSITRISDEKVLVTAQTLWCLLDATTQKPAMITEEIRTLFMSN